MPDNYFCDGDCGKQLLGRTTDIMIRRADRDGLYDWRRHRLCDDCAARNVFLIDKNGAQVSVKGKEGLG